MAKRRGKRSYRKKSAAWMPITKNGIKVGTAMIDLGLIGAAVETGGEIGGAPAYSAALQGDLATAFTRYTKAINPTKGMSGKIVVAGAAVSILGKVLGIRKIGPLNFN